MEVAITKMSQNGQVVIPSEVRKDAKIKTSTKFLVFNQGGNILLKKIVKERLAEELDFIESLERAEDDFKKGRVTKTNTNMSAKEIDKLLMR